MRIAIAMWTKTIIGGAETYVEQALAGLHAAGHSVALLTEVEARDTGKLRCDLPLDVPEWCIETDGEKPAFDRLAAWKPDLIYDQSLYSIDHVRRLQRMAPSVLYAHNYYGACISGGKLWGSPSYKCCERSLGWGCLLHYYPHRCGGRHPLRLISQFRTQMARRDLLGEYRAIFVASRHMKLEYERLGVPADRVRLIPYPIQRSMLERAGAGNSADDIERRVHRLRDATAPVQLLFVGRMEGSKGGIQAIDALPAVSEQLARPIELTLCGDGSQRALWAARAEAVERSSPAVRVRFAGWLSKGELDAEYRSAQALLVPSLWPEPFGLVGLEAGLFGLPSVAFAVGGISDWLRDGETGILAPADRLDARPYGEAIARLLRSPELYRTCANGALKQARGWVDLPGHIAELERAFQSLRREEQVAL